MDQVQDQGPAASIRGISRRRVLALAAASAATVAAADVLLQPGAASAAPPSATAPDFGPNVFVYDPATLVADIQAKMDELFALQGSNEMGTNRFAVLFKPGNYEVNARLGYYTTVAGLGLSPDDTNIHGAVRVTGYPDPNGPSGISSFFNDTATTENLAVA